MDTRDQRLMRYQSIMTRIKSRNTSGETPSAGDELTIVLDAVGAMHLLEAHGRAAILGWYGYGPKVTRGDPNWMGVIGWWRRSSFYSYGWIKQFGIWSKRINDDDEMCSIILGERELAFRGAFHNPESLHMQLHRDYRTYYVGDSSPPEDPLLSLPYEASRRLSIRLQLGDAVRKWAEALADHSSVQ